MSIIGKHSLFLGNGGTVSFQSILQRQEGTDMVLSQITALPCVALSHATGMFYFSFTFLGTSWLELAFGDTAPSLARKFCIPPQSLTLLLIFQCIRCGRARWQFPEAPGSLPSTSSGGTVFMIPSWSLWKSATTQPPVFTSGTMATPSWWSLMILLTDQVSKTQGEKKAI